MTAMLPLEGPVVVPSGSASGVVIVLAISGALIAALVLAEVLAAVIRAVGRRTWIANDMARRGRRPLRVVLVLAAVWIALRAVTDPPPAGPDWRLGVEHALLVGVIVSVAWLIGAMAFVAADAALARYRTDVADNRHARRVRTQIMILRRVTVAILVVAAIGGVLMTFDGARTAGAGIFASAGLLSVVAGLAAQTSLANVFAGLQLAFTDAIRVDDVVVVDGEWGRIEEITMTYVVVHVWDDRRLILPSTYFTTTPFENWTRRAADLLGTVELDLDWAVPVQAMRTELTRLLQASELWDHRVGVLQVTESTGGYVRVRALASAADAPTLFDLRCQVREGLVAWLQREHPEALPRTRLEGAGRVLDVAGPADVPGVPAGSTGGTGGTTSEAPTGETAVLGATGRRHRAGPGAPDAPEQTVRLDQGRDSNLFTGSLWAVERSKAFTGPGEEVIAEREHTAERETTGEPETTGEKPRVGDRPPVEGSPRGERP